MNREPLILLIGSGTNTTSVLESLQETVRQRYFQGYRVAIASPDTGAASTANILRLYREQGEHIALFMYEQNDPTSAAVFVELSSAFYPDARKVLITEQGAETPSGSHPTFDHVLVKPLLPAEKRLYPVLDELLADWRASVDMPFMRVKGIMTLRAVRIRIGDTLHRAAEAIALSGVGDLMVIDDDNNFVGVLSVGDVLRAAMPDIEEIMGEGGTMDQAFRLFLRKGSELMYKPVEPLVITNPLVVDPDDHVAKVAALMLEKNIHRLPVVKDGRLIGTVGRTDICQAVVGTL